MTCSTASTLTSTTTLNLNANPISVNHPSPGLSPVLRPPRSLNHERLRRTRRRFVPNMRYVPSSELPLLPFPIDQVLIPSESKTLHLFEARYLALLDESLFGKKKHFVHFVLDPIGISDTAEASFVARYGCLVLIEKVERLDVGALVSIRGIGRVRIVRVLERQTLLKRKAGLFKKAEPYLKGMVIPVQDVVPNCVSEVTSQSMELNEALHCLNSLEIKLKVPEEALLQTQIANSVKWAEKEFYLDSYEAFFPSFGERFSFAALQPVSGSTQSEIVKLQKEKLRAMDVTDTLERLDQSLEFVKNSISMVAAKLAIQSLEVQ